MAQVNLSVKQNHGHREQTAGCQGGRDWGGMEQKYSDWVTDKGLIFKTYKELKQCNNK